MKKIDDHLDKALLKEYEFKNEPLRAACFFIAEKAVDSDGFWPDEILFETILNGAGVIPEAYKILTDKFHALERTTESKLSSQHGKKIFKYKVTNKPILQAFLKKNKRNDIIEKSHPELF